MYQPRAAVVAHSRVRVDDGVAGSGFVDILCHGADGHASAVGDAAIYRPGPDNLMCVKIDVEHIVAYAAGQEG